MTRPPLLAADHLRELIRPITETVHVDSRRVPVPTTYGPGSFAAWTTIKGRGLHTITHPSLLDQIAHALTGSTAGMVMGGESGSKPAARLDALATLERIERESADRARAEGITETLPLRARLSRLAGVVPDIDRQVRSWWTAARLVTSWDSPPFSPRVPCPNPDCERRGTLRIRVHESTAVCVECGDLWGPDDVERLGEYIRWAAEHLTGARHWLTDDELALVECMECLPVRQQMAERSMARAQAARERVKTGRVAS